MAQQGNNSMERIFWIDGNEINHRKVEIADVLRSETAQMDKVYHGALLDSFKEDEQCQGITIHFRYDYKTENLSAL